jgi:hypothetical protein
MNESSSEQEQREAGPWKYGNEHSGARNAENFLTMCEIIGLSRASLLYGVN